MAGPSPPVRQDEATPAALNVLDKAARWLARLCTGAFGLRQMSLPDEHGATMHWSYSR